MITLRWRTHPERVESIKSMSKSEISRRRLKVHTSPVTSDDEKMNDDVEKERLEVAEPLEQPSSESPKAEEDTDSETSSEVGAAA